MLALFINTPEYSMNSQCTQATEFRSAEKRNIKKKQKIERKKKGTTFAESIHLCSHRKTVVSSVPRNRINFVDAVLSQCIVRSLSIHRSHRVACNVESQGKKEKRPMGFRSK